MATFVIIYILYVIYIFFVLLPGHGQCYCGNCYCAAGWHGDKCEFQCDISPWESKRRCTSPDGKICSNRGVWTLFKNQKTLQSQACGLPYFTISKYNVAMKVLITKAVVAHWGLGDSAGLLTELKKLLWWELKHNSPLNLDEALYSIHIK